MATRSGNAHLHDLIRLVALACVPWIFVLCLNFGRYLAAVMTDEPMVWHFWPALVWTATKSVVGLLSAIWCCQNVLAAAPR